MRRMFRLTLLVAGCFCFAGCDVAQDETAIAAGKSTVNLHNRSWNRVTVEARIGDDPNPEANRPLGARSLRRGESWVIESEGEDVWYRRDVNPDHPDGKLTVWKHRPCYPRRPDVYDENL